MNLFFEESGDFKVGAVLSQQGEAYQVETPTGKRTKVRARDVLLQFETPSPADMIAEANKLADEIDVSFLWEVAGQEEFGFAELGSEYYGHAPKPAEAAGLLLKIAASPIYFHKKGKGRYKAAPEATLQAALAGIEKKKQQLLVQAAQVEELKGGRLPDAMKPVVRQLLHKPDKNSIEYKALEAACAELQTTPARLLLAVGAIASAKELHFSRFLSEHFPRGTGFPKITLPAVAELPTANVQAFSIDDVTTTEIDDAFSVVPLDENRVRIGIHIAAPGLGIARDDAEKRQDWVLRGFRQFDAPVCVIITYDRELDGSDDTPFDCGAVTTALVNAAWSKGLGCVINSQGIMQSPVVREHARIPHDQVILKAVALGWPNKGFPANAVVSERKSLEEAARFVGFD